MKKCSFCGREFLRLLKHEVSCKKNPNRVDLSPEVKVCDFCSRKFKFLGNHQPYCRMNPKAESYPKRRLKALLEANRGRTWSEASKKKLSLSMKRAVAEFPESFFGINRWKRRSVYYEGQVFDSSWEVEVLKCFRRHNIRVERNTRAFQYHWNGDRSYTPDFYVPYYGVFLEIKGFETPKDSAKWESFPSRLLVLKANFVSIAREDRNLKLRKMLAWARQKEVPFCFVLHRKEDVGLLVKRS